MLFFSFKLLFGLSYGLEKMVEENYFGERRSFIVGKAYGGGNVFSSKEGIHTKLQIDIAVRNMFRVRRAVGIRSS
jgi:hypothetical protein